MVTIKEFARDCGISYEAIRKQIKRYEEELRGHIHQQGRTQYLDDVAVAFLREHRAPAPIAVYDASTDQRVQDLEQEVKDLTVELKDAYKEQARLHKQIGELQGLQARLEAAEANYMELEASRDHFMDVASEEAEKAREATRRAEEASLKAEELREALEASERRQKALMGRGLLARIFNQEV